ncbi:polynucleotide kinase [Microbacterium phage vB_MoxS-ISF9]|uniref:Polynucleotide kinase PNKP phosphatase domain-containing protein n=1 Tax=Microbacterium phage vB_MoxS-ISF9 TaxID=1458670 RepID=W8NP27_9CAUD|nr:polynucleotide kinase [Microbacterium phage vB_MoxS-ISF9]AHL18579.1 hypothetical protein ISF9_109 [Microbacterium phage vB_MoxS-ISF9]
MSYIEILRGLPASGKSTYAKERVKDSTDIVRVNRDAIRWTQGFFPFGSAKQEALVSEIEKALVEGALKAGKSVIIDATHLNPQYIRHWFKIAKAHSVRNVRVVDFEAPLEALKFRDGLREKSVGQDVIAKFAKRWKIGEDGKLPKAPVYDAALGPDLTPAAEWDSELPSAIIVDTDGTLANHEGVRDPYDTSRYHLDTPHQDVARVIWGLERVHQVIGVSGRDAKFAGVTLQWWKERALITPDAMFFRPEGDRRPDDVIKAEIYEKEIRGKYNIAGVFDDRGRVLRMWRAKGLTTFAVGDTDNNNF